MPSPYATQRPTTMRASLSNECATWRARRDLPMPGGPTIVASRHDDSHRRDERLTELGELSASTDERRDDGARKGGHVGTQAQQLPCCERPTLALRTDRDAGSTTTASRTRR